MAPRGEPAPVSERDGGQLRTVIAPDETCLGHLRAGDTLVVWRLDGLGRSLRHLIETVAELEEYEIGFESLTEGVDTPAAAGRMTFHIFGALAELSAA